MQRQRLLVPFVLTLSLLLAGCTFPWGGDDEEESTEGGYVKGPGAAFRVINRGSDPMRVSVSLFNEAGRELGNATFTLAAGDEEVRRFAIERHGQHVARLFYNWDSQGQAASGQDTQRFDSSQCPELSEFSWNLLQQGDDVGSQFLGKACAKPT